MVQEDLSRAARLGRGQATGTRTGPGLTDEGGEDSVGVMETVGPGPGRSVRVGMRLASGASVFSPRETRHLCRAAEGVEGQQRDGEGRTA